MALAVLKLPTGAVTAFLGLLLMREQFVPGLTALDTSAQILAWALRVRIRPTVVHPLVDQQAHTVLNGVRSKTAIPYRSGITRSGPAQEQSTTSPTPRACLPSGTLGDGINVTTQFDGWGYVHLFDAATGQELDTFAIPEAMDPAYASGFATSPCTRWRRIRRTPAFSICLTTPGGLRALQIQCSNPADTSTCELIEVGGYLDPEKPTSGASRSLRNPADDPNVQGDEVLILASDRDYGLFIFRDP